MQQDNYCLVLQLPIRYAGEYNGRHARLYYLVCQGLKMNKVLDHFLKVLVLGVGHFIYHGFCGERYKSYVKRVRKKSTQ